MDYCKCLTDEELLGKYWRKELIESNNELIAELDVIEFSKDGLLHRRVYENDSMIFEFTGNWNKSLDCYYDMNIDMYAGMGEAQKNIFTGEKIISFGHRKYYQYNAKGSIR